MKLRWLKRTTEELVEVQATYYGYIGRTPLYRKQVSTERVLQYYDDFSSTWLDVPEESGLQTVVKD